MKAMQYLYMFFPRVFGVSIVIITDVDNPKTRDILATVASSQVNLTL